MMYQVQVFSAESSNQNRPNSGLYFCTMFGNQNNYEALLPNKMMT